MPDFIFIISRYSYGDKQLEKLKKSLGNSIGFYDITEIDRENSIKHLNDNLSPKEFYIKLKKSFEQNVKTILSNLAKSKVKLWIILLPTDIPGIPSNSKKYYITTPPSYLTSISSYSPKNKLKLRRTLQKMHNIPKWKDMIALWSIGKILPGTIKQLSGFEQKFFSSLEKNKYKKSTLENVISEIKLLSNN
jgi:hypothetical protein